MLWEGLRIGEALGLRHEDLAAAEGELTVTPRVNDNRARAKSVSPRTIPVGPELVRLYADYLHTEYGELDSDYMFVNLWGGAIGRPLSYASVYDLVLRIRREVGFGFDPHWFRHTRATLLLRRGVPIEVVSTLLGHSSITTTLDIYGHLSVEDARRALEAAGFLYRTRCGGDRGRDRSDGDTGSAGQADGRGPPGVPCRASWCPSAGRWCSTWRVRGARLCPAAAHPGLVQGPLQLLGRTRPP